MLVNKNNVHHISIHTIRVPTLSIIAMQRSYNKVSSHKNIDTLNIIPCNVLTTTHPHTESILIRYIEVIGVIHSFFWGCKYCDSDFKFLQPRKMSKMTTMTPS
jgi:hypothetical protein